MRNKFFAFILLISVAVSCKKSTPITTDNFIVALKATLSGSGETPSNTSKATGTAEATYNKNTHVLLLYITYSGVTATAIDINKGAVGVNGSTVFSFTTLASPINASFTLTPAQETDLLAKLYYINIHSSAYTNGEIRGQLLIQ